MSNVLNDLKERMISDLKTLNVNVKGFELVLRPFSKTYLGRFNPNNRKLFIYVYKDSHCTTLYSYGQLFDTLLHEVTHFIQWSDPNYERIKGVMHNSDFHKIYNKLLNEYKRKEKDCVIKS